jgi:hypothetical protein
MISEFLQEQFNIRAENPAIWALSARRLKHSGDLIFDAYEIDLQRMTNDVSPLELNNLEVAGAATLLFGLATENLLKAIIIAKGPKTVEDGKLRDWPSNGHELILLAEKANIMLNARQKDLLQRLVAFVEWAGRYPVPKKVTKISLKQLDIKRPFLPLPLQPFERKLFGQLFEFLWAFIFTDSADKSANAG